MCRGGKILPMTDSATAGEEVEKSFCRLASWEITRVSSVLFPTRELLPSEWLLLVSIIFLIRLRCSQGGRSVGRSVPPFCLRRCLSVYYPFPRTPDFAA